MIDNNKSEFAVLFVDDEEKARKMFVRLVSSHFTVFTASDVKEGGGGGVEASFRHILNLRGVSSMIVGTINHSHLQDNVSIVNRILSS